MSWIDLANPVAEWWYFLLLVSAINISAWFFTRAWLRERFRRESREGALLRSMIALSGVYVFGCAIRGIFPKADVQRICLFDTWFSSVMFGRSVATAAELSFVAQWALALKYLGEKTETPLAQAISWFVVPLICMAEICSWYAVITTNYVGNMIEESLWTVTYALVLIALASLIPKIQGGLKTVLSLACVGVALYIVFMARVDVPMYYGRWRGDLAQGKSFFGLMAGLRDLNTHWVVTHDWVDWKTEIPWMSSYFSLAVLGSIALCYLPQPPEKWAKRYLLS